MSKKIDGKEKPTKWFTKIERSIIHDLVRKTSESMAGRDKYVGRQYTVSGYFMSMLAMKLEELI